MADEGIADLVLRSAIDYAIIATDLGRKVTFWNEGAEHLLGWSAEEMLDQLADVFFVEEDRADSIPEREAETALREGRALDERWHLRRDGTRFWGSGEMMPLIVDGTAAGFVKIVRDQTAKRRAEELQLSLNAELNHRAKNMTAMVIAIVRQSFRDRTDLREIQDLIVGRLTALAEAQQLIVEQDGDNADVGDILRRTLEPHRQGRSDRIALEGLALKLGRDAAISLALIAHELATNAVKYGALSSPEGRVEITWRVIDLERARAMELSWMERGGPPVGPPSRKGLGTALIQAGITGTSGDVKLDYAPEGLRCTIRAVIGSATGWRR